MKTSHLFIKRNNKPSFSAAKITDKTIQSYIRQSQKDTSKKYLYSSVGNNLWLRVHTKTGNAAWLYRIAMPDSSQKTGYKFTYLTIGQYPAITLLQARIKSSELAMQIKSGINPVEQKQQVTKNQTTLKQIWDKWMAIANIKPITRLKLNGMFNNHIIKLANHQIQSITDKMAWDTIIQPILDANNRTQARIVLT